MEKVHHTAICDSTHTDTIDTATNLDENIETMENIHCEAMGDSNTTNISDIATDLDEKIETMKRMKERTDSNISKV